MCETHVITCEHVITYYPHVSTFVHTVSHINTINYFQECHVHFMFLMSFTYSTCDFNTWLSMWSSCGFSDKGEKLWVIFEWPYCICICRSFPFRHQIYEEHLIMQCDLLWSVVVSLPVFAPLFICLVNLTQDLSVLLDDLSVKTIHISSLQSLFFVSFSSWIWHSTCLSAHLRGLEQPLLPWWAFPLLSLMFYLSFFLTLLLCFCIVCIFRESKCPFRAIHEIWIDLWVLLILWMYRHLHERKYEIYAQQVCYRNQGLQNYSLKACLKWNRHPRPLVK